MNLENNTNEVRNNYLENAIKRHPYLSKIKDVKQRTKELIDKYYAKDKSIFSLLVWAIKHNHLETTLEKLENHNPNKSNGESLFDLYWNPPKPSS